ncbi:MAG: ATP-binding protein [Planctomycetota bacterium]
MADSWPWTTRLQQTANVDDLTSSQQSREGIEVLFTLLAERYGRGSAFMTSKLVLGKWGQIYNNPPTAAATSNRLTRHHVIVEIKYRSCRSNAKSVTNRAELTTVDEVLSKKRYLPPSSSFNCR